MSSVDGSEGAPITRPDDEGPSSKVELLLVEALMHTLFEKGILSKNDTLDIVESVTDVTRGALHEETAPLEEVKRELRMLERLYRSFEALDSLYVADGDRSANVVALRPPLHGDTPSFPTDDN